MDTRSNSHNFVRVYSLVRLFPCQLVGNLLHLWHAGHPPDENKLIDFAGAHSCLLEAVADRLFCSIEKGLGELFHL